MLYALRWTYIARVYALSTLLSFLGDNRLARGELWQSAGFLFGGLVDK